MTVAKPVTQTGAAFTPMIDGAVGDCMPSLITLLTAINTIVDGATQIIYPNVHLITRD